MKEGYRLLGDFIRQVDVRNTDGKEENLLGVSVQKMFIPSIANTVGTDFTKYKVVKRGQFTYIPDTSRRGDKIGIALLTDYDEGLVSNIYTVFEVKDENELLPEYLMLWFSRPEFDRYARFKSHGSVREIMDWDEMCKVKLPVPSIEKQRSIVKAYNTITDRIELKRKINDNLEATGLAIFKEKFSSPNDGFDEIPLYDLAEYINGTSFSEDEYSSDGLPIIKIAELKDGITSATQYFVGNKDPKYLIHDSDVLFSWSGNPDTSIDAFIWSHGDGILNQHTFRMVPRNGEAFTYFMLKFCKPEFVKAAMGKQTTGLGHVTVKDLKRLTLPFNEETAVSFNQAAMPLYEQIFKNLKEINALIELRNQTVQMLSIIYH